MEAWKATAWSKKIEAKVEERLAELKREIELLRAARVASPVKHHHGSEEEEEEEEDESEGGEGEHDGPGEDDDNHHNGSW